MSLVHYLSGTSPMLSSYQNPGYSGSRVKTQVAKCSPSLLYSNTVHKQFKCRTPAGVVSKTCPRKPHQYVRDAMATKAVNSDDPTVSSFDEEELTVDLDWDDDVDEGSPWEGAIVYQRNPSISHMEYCTTLERLGLGKLSSEVSRSRASAMGLRVTKAVTEYLDGTPVLVSVDITRKKRKLRLDGIIRSVISLACNRCGEPAAESVFSNFSLLLTEEPVVDPDDVNMGTIYGEDNFKGSAVIAAEEEDEEDASIDLEDRLYFPSEEKRIDISKHIRDLVHLEITINSICDSSCKGVCLQCGTNLNTRICNCNQEKNDVSYGPLGELRKQMQQK